MTAIWGWLVGWAFVSVMLACVWAGVRRNQKQHHERMQRGFEEAWTRAHGGNPDYAGNLRGKREAA